MNYPVLVNPRKPSLSRMPMKKPKRASAAKAKKGPKPSAGRSKVALKRPAKRRIKGPARRPTRPSQRAASADDGAKAAIEPAINATIRELRSKLRGALRRVAELEAAADTDFLLEIPNRRGFERELARAVAYMKRYRASGALIVLDVDRLKPINDSFGHAAGDEVLKAIATTLTRQIRASDVVGRLRRRRVRAAALESQRDRRQGEGRGFRAGHRRIVLCLSRPARERGRFRRRRPARSAIRRHARPGGGRCRDVCAQGAPAARAAHQARQQLVKACRGLSVRRRSCGAVLRPRIRRSWDRRCG
ncbi:GGDEF domain-containing protein [Bradyrhizobium sp. GM22.5]